MSKTLVICRGLPGSGKSTLAKTYGGKIFSTDDFFMKNGKYQFNPKQLGIAHKTNQKKAIEAMESGEPIVVIDNTNTTWKEIKPYWNAGMDNEYDIKLQTPDTEWAFDVDELVKKNTHGVPREAIQKMNDRWHTNHQILEFAFDTLEEIPEANIEIIRALLADKPSEALKNLGDALFFTIPELRPLVGMDQGKYHSMTAFEHTMAVVDGTPKDLVLRAAALFHDIGKGTTRTYDEDKDTYHFYGHETVSADIARATCPVLGLDEEQTNKVCKIVALHMHLLHQNITSKAVRKFKTKIGNDLEDAIEVMTADRRAHRPEHVDEEKIQALWKKVRETDIDRPKNIKLVEGADLALAGFTPGPEFPALLKKADEIATRYPGMSQKDVIAELKKTKTT